MKKLCQGVLFFLAMFAVQAEPIDLSQFTNLKIRNVGPANMSGRITAIDVVEQDPSVLYVGAASGGVWKSENGGSAWRPVFDEQPTQNIGALAIQQNNPSIVWVGTGEGNPRNSMNLGMGIFKSQDGGDTWSHLGLEATKTIHRIITHPDNADIIYAGAMGDPFTPGEHRGLYKSVDGGESWQKILFTNDQSGIADLVMDPNNPNKLIAAMYQHRRTPYYFTSGGEGSGIYMTYDAGKNWKRLTEADGIPAGDLGRVGLAIAPSDTNRVYAKIEAKRNALYRSDDAGKSWSKINDNPRFTNNRPFYFQELAVDSKDANRLYNIYQPLSVSYDGGMKFDPIPMIPADETKGIHADFHAFWMNPNDPRHFIIGGDGGIGITRDHGKSWYFPETIPVAQFYHISVDNDRPYNVYGGMQDNGNWSGPGYTWKRGGIRTLYWQYLVGGDGFYIEPDEDNSRFGYGTSQNGNLYRYDKLTGYYSSIKPRLSSPEAPLRFNWNAAFAKDPFNKNGVYYGAQYVLKSDDKGASWRILSPDLSTNNQEHQQSDYGGLTLDISGAENYNSILAIAPSSLDENLVWAGTDDGQLHLTRDAGKSWQNLTKKLKGMPKEAWIAQIQASTFDPATAWVVVNNYRKGDYDPYLFKTENYGKTWKRMTNPIQVKGYALSVVQDTKEPNLVFLGTENGLWLSIDEGKNWEQFKNGFPSVSTMGLKIQQSESALIIGTFGRAIWIIDDLLSLREVAAGRVKQDLTALPVNDAVQVKGLFIAPPGNIWTGFHTTFEGENRVFQKTEIPYYLDAPVTDDTEVTATIYNGNNEQIQTVTAKPTANGLNYLIWKLDEYASNLPGAWIHDESRGIPVLPGTYKVEIKHGDNTDVTHVKVIADPRFDLVAEVDSQLYQYQKAVDVQVASLSETLNLLDAKLEALDTLQVQLSDLAQNEAPDLLEDIDTARQRLISLKAQGKTPKPDRQVGAWQTSLVTPYSKVRDTKRIAMSRLRPISQQENTLLEDAAQTVKAYNEQVNAFMDKDWQAFIKRVQAANINWLQGL